MRFPTAKQLMRMRSVTSDRRRNGKIWGRSDLDCLDRERLRLESRGIDDVINAKFAETIRRDWNTSRPGRERFMELIVNLILGLQPSEPLRGWKWGENVEKKRKKSVYGGTTNQGVKKSTSQQTDT